MKRNVVSVAATAILALCIVSPISLPTKLVYNSSPSAPVGLYWIDDGDAKRGDYVLVHVPDRMRNLIEERRYVPPDTPLIKRVAGAKGDRVCRQEGRILINDMVVAVARNTDGLGRIMPKWDGCHALSGARVFLLQDHADSFDSRYFGPVDRRLIIGRATYLRLPWRKHRPS